MQEFSYLAHDPVSPSRRTVQASIVQTTLVMERETKWRRGLTACCKVIEGVGVSYVHIGELNTVHPLAARKSSGRQGLPRAVLER